MKDSRRPVSGLLLDRRQQCLGSTAVHQGIVFGLFEKRFQVKKTAFVLWPHSYPLGITVGEVLREGHGGLGPSAIQQCPVTPCSLYGFEHRQDRCDTDAPSDEPIMRRINQGKMVARAAYSHSGTLVEVAVHVARAAATVRIEQDPDAPQTRIVGVTAQRVLTCQSIVEKQVDMGARFPARQVFVFWMAEVEHHYTFRRCAAMPDNQIGCELMYVGTGCGDGGRRHRFVAPIVTRNQFNASRIAYA